MPTPTDDILVQIEHAGQRQRIRRSVDTDPANPRTETDNLWTWLCSPRSGLGDASPRSQDECDSQMDAVEADPQQRLVVSIYMYKHSGIRLSLTPFSDPWDSAQVGVAVVSLAKLAAEGLDEDAARSALQNEITIYEQYLNGEVYGYQVEQQPLSAAPDDDNAWETVDACWGFFGDDPQVNGMYDHWPPLLAGAYAKAHVQRPVRAPSR